jgi:hypothetical protein
MRDLYRRPTSQDLSILKEGRDADTSVSRTRVLEFIVSGHVSQLIHFAITLLQSLNLNVSKTHICF